MPAGIRVSRRAHSRRRVWAAGPAERPFKKNQTRLLSRREGAASSTELVCAQASAPEEWGHLRTSRPGMPRLERTTARPCPHLPSGRSVVSKVTLCPAQETSNQGLQDNPQNGRATTSQPQRRVTSMDRIT